MTRCLRLATLLIAAGVCAGSVAEPAHGQAAPAPFLKAYRYNAEGEVVGAISPDPDGNGANFLAERNTYDAAGRLIRAEKGVLATWQSEAVAPASWPGFTVHEIVDTVYDILDRKLRETSRGSAATASVTDFSYDLAGREECTAVRMNLAALPAVGNACALGVQGSQGPDRITRRLYGAAGELRQIRKAVGTPLEQAYVTYSYTPNGEQDYVVDANGNRARLTYDGFDRQAGWYFPSKTRPAAFNPATPDTALATAGAVSSADFEAYGYDSHGNRTSLRKRDGALLTFRYDRLDRLTLKTVPGRANLAAIHTRDVYYAYDLRGLQTEARFDSLAGPGISNVYDGFGQLKSSTSSMFAVPRTLSYSYDADGNRIRFSGAGTFTYDYDGLDRPTTLSEAGLYPLVSFGYDSAGRRSSVGFVGALSSYRYDGGSRLDAISHDLAGATADQQLGFSYNAADQLVTRTSTNDAYAPRTAYNVSRGYTVNGLNQYSAAGSAVFSYDANGNLIADGASSFLYDVENRLVSASGRSAGSLLYDPLGRLFQVTSSSGEVTQFVYDGDALVMEVTPTGTSLRRYAHGNDGDSDDPLLWYEYAGASWRRGLFTDHQGSVIAVTDLNGNPLAINGYDAWGIPNAGNAGRFQYTGQIWLAELGLYHYKARLYSPFLGRFLQTDPVGYDDQLNLYAYVGNDPLNEVDPTGECPFCKVAVDFGIEIGIQVLTTGKVDVGAAAVETAKGAVNPLKTLERGRDLIRAVKAARSGSGIGSPAGQAGKQARLRALAGSPKVGRADRGWLKQEINSVKRGQRTKIRMPPGKALAHERGREAAKGYDHRRSNLQEQRLHYRQHRYDNNGRKNKHRPIE